MLDYIDTDKAPERAHCQLIHILPVLLCVRWRCGHRSDEIDQGGYVSQIGNFSWRVAISSRPGQPGIGRAKKGKAGSIGAALSETNPGNNVCPSRDVFVAL